MEIAKKLWSEMPFGLHAARLRILGDSEARARSLSRRGCSGYAMPWRCPKPVLRS